VSGDLTKTVSKKGAAAKNQRTNREAPRLTVVCEYGRLTAPALRVALGDLQEVTVGRGSQRSFVRQGTTATLSVPDDEISRKHLAVRRQVGGWEVVDLGSKNGILVNGTPVDSISLTDGDLIEAGGTLLMFREEDSGPDGAPDRDLAVETATPITFRTVNVELEGRVRQLTKIARGNVSVLIRGETGTGKELIARAIHDISARRGPFVPINCGELPRNLIESELFGHKRGAFSGASENRDGLVRSAHGGTLFLDEVAELPEESQATLLRVLQEGEVRPIGAHGAVKVDIRVVAATHQDILMRCVAGRFRQDLYARLAGFEMMLPALRDRLEDLGTLIAAILPRVASEPERITLDHYAARALFRYAWPLNIRELEQALRVAVALTDTGEIQLEHLSEAIRTYTPWSPVAAMKPEDRIVRDHLITLLREHGGNVSAVGRRMGKAPMQIRRWCQHMQIELSQFRKRRPRSKR
jgi:transcriptional regulator of aromatic amino acid metabolism